METVDLNASLRRETGKQVTRKLRAQGLLPAVLYGAAAEPMALTLEAITLERIFRAHGTGNVLLNLQMEGQASALSIIRERQRHPVSGALVHVDFQRISLDKPIHIDVPIRLQGESPGVKDMGGILEHLMRSAELSCLPMEAPDEIVVDISALGLNESIHVRDLDVPGVTFLAESDRTVVMVAPPRLVKTAAEAEAEAAALAEAAEGEAGGEGEAKGED